MISRALVLCGGVAGAVCLAQFPAFSQQYLQRLAGQADVLQDIVADFDTDAAEAGLTREEALAELSGTAFLDERGDTMRRTIARAERVEANLTVLRLATPIERLMLPHRFDDMETLQATWSDFRPGVQMTSDGILFAVIGFLVGTLFSWSILSLLMMPVRRWLS